MKKIIALTFLTLLYSCKPIIFPYKPVGNSDLVKEGEFYYLTTTNGKIGYYPRVWINPKAGIECDIKLENIEIDSIEKIDVFNENTDKIIEITKDSIRHLFNPELNQINLTQVKKGYTIKKEKLKQLNTIKISIDVNGSSFSSQFKVIEKTIN